MDDRVGWEAIGVGGHITPPALAEARAKAREAWERRDALIEKLLAQGEWGWAVLTEKATAEARQAERDAEVIYFVINAPDYNECTCIETPEGRIVCPACKDYLKSKEEGND
jgi:hypothetical protein